jgi:hypothetical protein
MFLTSYGLKLVTLLKNIVNDPNIDLLESVSYQRGFVVYVELKSYLYFKYSIFEPCKPNPRSPM